MRDLQDTMPRQRLLVAFHLPFFTVTATDLRERILISDAFYPTLLVPREVEDFSRGYNHKHVPLLTYQVSFQLVYYNSWLGSMRVKTFCLW